MIKQGLHQGCKDGLSFQDSINIIHHPSFRGENHFIISKAAENYLVIFNTYF